MGGALGTIGAGDQFMFGFSMTNFVQDHPRQLLLIWNRHQIAAQGASLESFTPGLAEPGPNRATL